MSTPTKENHSWRTFDYILSKKVLCNDIINDSNIRFTKDSQNYLQDFYIQVNNTEFADAEIISKKKSNKLKKILTIKSGMEIDARLSDYEGIPKTGGFRRIGKTLTSSYCIKGGIEKLDLVDSNIQRLIENGSLNLIPN